MRGRCTECGKLRELSLKGLCRECFVAPPVAVPTRRCPECHEPITEDNRGHGNLCKRCYNREAMRRYRRRNYIITD